jgi:hypothetical protein
MTASTLLFITVVLIGLIWTRGVRWAATKEYPGNDHKMLLYALMASLVFALLLVINSLAGITGVLRNFEARPPLFVFYFPMMMASAFAIGFSPLGTLLARRASFWALIGFHVFRFLAEYLIHLGVLEGIAPKQLSFEGYNFDILTASSALVVAIFIYPRGAVVSRVAKRVIMAWNIFGVLALVNIGFIAITSMPLPIRLFMSEPSNIWVTQFPYILLPGILVVAAWVGHIIIFRKLKMECSS